VEFNHQQQVQGDLIDLHETIAHVANTGSKDSVGVQVGTTYPSRMIFFNPPPPAGTISTTEEQNVEIHNITGNGNDAPHFSGSVTGLSTRSIKYTPRYNEFDNAPTTVFEHGILYNQFEDGHVFVNQGSVVDGTDIDLAFTTGEYAQTSAGSVSFNVKPVSAPSRKVTVEDDGDPIEIVLPTELPQEAWNDLMANEAALKDAANTSYSANPYVDESAGEVTIVLKKGTYNLEMAHVSLNEDPVEPGPEYITPVGANTVTIVDGVPDKFEFEVRDKYNNPVSNELVNVSVDGTEISASPLMTDANGRVEVSKAPSSMVTAELDCSSCASDSATINVNTFSTGINPSESVRLVNSETTAGGFWSGVFANYSGTRLTFKTGNSSFEPTQVRFSHYHFDSDSSTPSNRLNATMAHSSDDDETVDLTVGGPYKSADNLAGISADSTGYYDIVFWSNEFGCDFLVCGTDPEEYDSQPGDFFVLEVVWKDDNGRTTQSTYIASPEDYF
jgi:hypothetical protein